MSTNEPMTREQLDAIQERAGEVTTLRSADFNDWQELALDLSECVDDLLAEVERLKPFESIVSWRYGDTTDGRTREDMVTRAVEAHHAAFNAWPVKRSLEDAYHRRVAAMRAAIDAALGTGERA